MTIDELQARAKLLGIVPVYVTKPETPRSIQGTTLQWRDWIWHINARIWCKYSETVDTGSWQDISPGDLSDALEAWAGHDGVVDGMELIWMSKNDRFYGAR